MWTRLSTHNVCFVVSLLCISIFFGHASTNKGIGAASYTQQECSGFTDCKSCNQQTNCSWCLSNNTCSNTSSMASCPTWADTSCCNTNTLCLTCSSDTNCIFCRTTNACQEVNSQCPLQSDRLCCFLGTNCQSCVNNNIFSKPRTINKNQLQSSADSNQEECEWCGATSLCIVGSATCSGPTIDKSHSSLCNITHLQGCMSRASSCNMCTDSWGCIWITTGKLDNNDITSPFCYTGTLFGATNVYNIETNEFNWLTCNMDAFWLAFSIFGSVAVAIVIILIVLAIIFVRYCSLRWARRGYKTLNADWDKYLVNEQEAAMKKFEEQRQEEQKKKT